MSQDPIAILNVAVQTIETGILDLASMSSIVSGLQTVSGQYVALLNSGANVSGYVSQINLLSGEVTSLTAVNQGLVTSNANLQTYSGAANNQISNLTSFSGSAMSYLQQLQTAADALNLVLPSPVSGTVAPFGLV